MRIAFAIPLLLLGACQVSKDNGNGTTSITYNSDVAENDPAPVEESEPDTTANTDREPAGAIADTDRVWVSLT